MTRPVLCILRSLVAVCFLLVATATATAAVPSLTQACPGGSVLLSAESLALSRMDCSGESAEQRRCLFRNVFVSQGVIWIVSDAPSETKLPVVLCSAVTKTHQHAKYCKFRIVSRQEALNELHKGTPREGGVCVKGINAALAFGRLARANCYHSLFEDLIPIYETLTKYPSVFYRWLGLQPPYSSSRNSSTGPSKSLYSIRGSSDNGGLHLQYRDMILFVEDDSPDYDTNYYTYHFWKRFFPHVLVVDKYTRAAPDKKSAEVYFVHSLVAGSNSSCVHYYHCSRGSYTTPRVAMAFRQFILEKVGISDKKLERGDDQLVVPVAAPAKGKSDIIGPKIVTIIQRQYGESRQLMNLNEILTICNSVFGEEGNRPAKLVATRNTTAADTSSTPCVVRYYGNMSLDDQIRQTHSSDILICVHGGALGNVLFAKHLSTVIDIYPYSFPYSFHGLMNWIRFSLWNTEGNHSSYRKGDQSDFIFIGHAPFEVKHAEDMFFSRRSSDGLGVVRTRLVPLTPCVCNTTTRLVWFKCGFGKMFYRAAGMQIHPVQFRHHLILARSQWQRRQVNPPHPHSHAQLPSLSSQSLSLQEDVPPVPKTVFKEFSLSLSEPWYYANLRTEAIQAFLEHDNNQNMTTIDKNEGKHMFMDRDKIENRDRIMALEQANTGPDTTGGGISSDSTPAPAPDTKRNASINAKLPDCSDHLFFKPRHRGKKKKVSRPLPTA